MSVSVKNVVAINFMFPIIKAFYLQYCPFCNVLSEIKSCSDAVDYFKELPFYNKHIEKPNVKPLKNIDQLAELPFYEQLSVIQKNQVFGGYAISYKVEIIVKKDPYKVAIIEKKDPIVQLEASKLSIKDLFSDLLNETKGFKYQIAVKVLLKNRNSMEKLNLLQFILIQ